MGRVFWRQLRRERASSYHPAERGCTSDWSTNSSIMVVYENSVGIFLPKSDQKRILIDNCHGMTKSVKVHRKDQSVKDFTSKCLFLLFWLISCISLIFLIEIWSFCTNLLENYPLHRIDQLPLLRILSLCMDNSMQTRINTLYLFLLFLFAPLALFGQNDVRIHALVCTIVYSVLDQVFPMLGSIPQYMDHLLISLLLTCRYFP